MAVFYRLHQDQSTGTKRSGKWYARAVPTAVIGTRQLAEIIQRNCTVKKSDVMAVLEELVEVMKDQMQDSKRVKLDGFGSFKIGIESKGAQTAGKYSVSEHVTGLHVVFMPERTTDSGGNKSKQFLQGCKVEELPLNTVEKEEPQP
jgi:predicted histone-like DNA-binding protein